MFIFQALPSYFRLRLQAALVPLVVVIGGCATPSEMQAPIPCAGRCPVCPVCVAAEAPEPTPAAVLSPAVVPIVAAPGDEAARGRLERAAWPQLPNFAADDATEALSAFLQGCPVLAGKAEWQDVCTRATAMAATQAKSATQNKKTAAQVNGVTQFFIDNFEPYRVVNLDETDTGLVTGYYEPLLRGSRTQSAEFRYPLYRPPQDLIAVDLAEVYPDLKNRRLRGRIVDNKLVPYLDRAAIEGDRAAPPLRGLEIAWVDNAVESFFLHIQGSGQIQLPNGSLMRVGYADQNGHPFRSLGSALIRRGEIKAERASMQGIKEWARRNPAKLQQFMNANPSYVFFKELPGDLTGPIGTLGVPLTAERSIAVDPRVIPLGVPVYLSTTFPNTKNALNRLMVAQDTGGAIGGAVRADFYWGFGDAAGNQAGKMKQQGRMWVLLPSGYDPNAAIPPATPPASPPASPPQTQRISAPQLPPQPTQTPPQTSPQPLPDTVPQTPPQAPMLPPAR